MSSLRLPPSRSALGFFALVCLAGAVIAGPVFARGAEKALDCERFDFRDEVGGEAPGFINAGLGDGDPLGNWMSDDGVAVYGQGSDLYHGNDNGTFLYRQLPNVDDFRVETPLPDQIDISNATYQKGGLMVRFGLDPLAPRVMVMLVNLHPNGRSIQFDVRTSQGAVATEMASTMSATGIDRLAIERKDGVFVVEVSSDGGSTWLQPQGALGGEAVLQDAGDPLVGMAVASYEPAEDVAFVFPEFDICAEAGPPVPPPIEVVDGCLSDSFDDGYVDMGWTTTSMGDADQVSIAEAGGELELTGDGSTLFSSGTDHGGFTHRAVSGDFRVELTVDVSEMGPGGPFRKGGLMVRAGLYDTAIRFIAQLAPDWDNEDGPALQFRYRSTPGARGDQTWGGNRFGVPERVRFAIERRDSTLTVFYSFDEGATWVQPPGGVGGSVTVPGLPSTLYVGPNVVSYDANQAVTAQFDDFDLCAPEAVGGLVWWDQDGNAQVDDAELGRPMVQLEIRTLSNQKVFTTYTDEEGRFLFPDVAPGSYRLLIDSPLRMSGLPVPTYDLDGVEDPSSWEIAFIDVEKGEQLLNADFGWRSTDRYSSLCVEDDFEDGILDTTWTSRLWYITDFGNADQVAAVESAGVLELSSDGSSLYAGDDHGAYLFQAYSGDFRVEVDVDGTDMLTGGPYRKGGLMVRPVFGSEGARLISQLVPYWNDTSKAVLQFRYRATDGGQGDGAWGSNVQYVPRQVRLAIERVGNIFSTQYSFDGGATWQSPAGGAGGQITLDWPETVMVGLNAVSYDTSTASTMVFDNFLICE